MVRLCSIFIVIYLLSPSVICHASTPEEKYDKIQKEIKSKRLKLYKAKKRESSILTEIEKINRQLKIVESDLRKYRRRIANIEASISKVEAEILQNKSSVLKHREWLKRKLRAIHRYGQNTDTIMLLLGTEDLSQIMRRSTFLQYISVYEHKLLSKYKDAIETLNVKEKKLKTLKSELIKNKERMAAEERSLSQKKKQKERLLVSVKNEGTSYKKMLKELKETSDKLLEIIKESERAAKDTDFSVRGFSKLKGKLPWPVDGKILIPYGSQKDPQFDTPIFRSGTYIGSNSNSLAKAVHTGKVVFAEWFKGYGQLVIVNHGEGYHTLYGSLSEIFTKVGDIIKMNEIIGRVGNSGILNSTGLYFELRYKGRPLDPLQWLKRK